MKKRIRWWYNERKWKLRLAFERMLAKAFPPRLVLCGGDLTAFLQLEQKPQDPVADEVNSSSAGDIQEHSSILWSTIHINERTRAIEEDHLGGMLLRRE